ncbi:MAG: hypothetical protein N0A24_08180 [Armatimonadetes bacterium]|nr:hypothetical protein [Armatimonadota bacterium]MDW8154172.1 hypothetical protein [Armatimonadota bacterium]
MARLEVGSPAPEWTAEALDGGRVGSATLRGRPVVLVFLRGLR